MDVFSEAVPCAHGMLSTGSLVSPCAPVVELASRAPATEPSFTQAGREEGSAASLAAKCDRARAAALFGASVEQEELTPAAV
mmetsp:Transcript_65732/g.116452  ORF Transcript_65732/g.116452 Transcript_65732/m.116452 type:complete len:82 (+) Transcript_65732:277-522(+)